MLLAFRLVMYVAGGYLSMACATEIGSNKHYNLIGFAVGPIFGVVVLLWQSDSVPSLAGLASLKFLLLSTLVWSLIDWLLHALDGDKYLERLFWWGRFSFLVRTPGSSITHGGERVWVSCSVSRVSKVGY
jgi:hypothetical protein